MAKARISAERVEGERDSEKWETDWRLRIWEVKVAVSGRDCQRWRPTVEKALGPKPR